MATLNTSTNGPSISKSYHSIINAPSAPASKSSTYGQWAVFSVSAPLANAFQPDAGGKESVLKVQSTSDGELANLVDDFSDGRIQFAFVRVNDPNTKLPKFVLIAWCGEGVPERTKGYFTSHVATVSRILHGYHVQVTARSDRDLTPESIIQKVSDASGSKYSGSSFEVQASDDLPPSVASKPAFTPTQSSRGTKSLNPLLSSRLGLGVSRDMPVDENGWGEDAPPVIRTGLEKVQSSYQPTKVNMREFSSQKAEPSVVDSTSRSDDTSTDVVKGGYQPTGRVDIAALRKEAKQSANAADNRPNVVRGSYEPIGKVDIAAIRARAQPPSERDPLSSRSLAATGDQLRTSEQSDEQRSLPDRSAPYTSSERLTSLPKPKVAHRFGGGATNFTGTKAPVPGDFRLESKSITNAPSVGVGRTYADQGGKTPAQLWAEKKAHGRGLSGASNTQPPAGSGSSASLINSQESGGREWKSGYTGKSWGPVQTTRTGQSASSVGEQRTGEEERDPERETTPVPIEGISAIRDRFKDAPPMGAATTGAARSAPSPPPLDTSNKPNAGRGIPIPGLLARRSENHSDGGEEGTRMPPPPPQPPRSPTPPTPPGINSGSPIEIAMPVSRSQSSVPQLDDAREEQFSPPPAMPTRSLARQVPHEDSLTEDPSGHDPARGAGEAAAAASLGGMAAEAAHVRTEASGKRALVQYDYEKAEDNELELKEGEHVTNIDMVDEDWWMGENPSGEVGLFPSNYVELIADEEHGTAAAPAFNHGLEPELVAHRETTTADTGRTATALYDYDAAENNELSFPENAKIIGIVSRILSSSGLTHGVAQEFPDDDWWSGEYHGKQGLFPANYVQLDQGN
ncbi:MAG: hypothetical protein L6R35_004074 [Caloplaca aegaea]|nr:MAG: hypothetical protein L6R35_004074 [Caloplaca aegaea]